MTSPLEIRSRSQMIDKRLKELFIDLRDSYNRGEIKTRTEYLYEIFSRTRKFYETIGRPTFSMRRMEKVPESEGYNAMLQELEKDLGLLYSEAQEIAEALHLGFVQIDIERRSLENQVRHLEGEMKNLSSTWTGEANKKTFRETFVDEKNLDIGMVRDNLAQVWGREGVLTLMPKTSEDHTKESKVVIVEGNGLPGNTKQVETVEGKIRFIGEEGLHVNLAEVLDNNADTWFEYESFEVASAEVKQTDGIGLEYKEGVSWTIDNSKKLTVVIKVTLETARPINWLSLNPFIPNEKGANGGRVERIEILDGKGGVYVEEIDDKEFDEEKIFMFGYQECKHINITLTQEQGYETEVGHLFYKEMERQQTNYLGRTKYYEGRRVNGPLPSVTNLNVNYDEEEKRVKYKEARFEDVIENEAQMKDELFMLPSIDPKKTNLEVGYEKISARRYAIGVREIGVANYQFEKSSEYVSKEFKSEEEIVSVRLTTKEEVPKEFLDGEWVRYWMSPNNGKDWYRIFPKGATKEGSKILYLFNTNTPSEGRIEHFGYVDLENVVTGIRLKIEIERPEGIKNATYYSPVIKEYEIEVTTRGGAL